METSGDDCKLLAREVHDRIGAGLALTLRRLELLESQTSGFGPAELRRLAQVREALEDTLRVTRGLAETLRQRRAPVSVSAPSLETALRGFLRALEIREPRVSLQVDGGEAALPPVVAEAAFNVVREALRNALQHARAQQITVYIGVGAKKLRAEVCDDGIGFDPSATTRGGTSCGLLGMRERAKELGGGTSISSAPGYGTRLKLWIPLEQGSEEGRSRHGRLPYSRIAG